MKLVVNIEEICKQLYYLLVKKNNSSMHVLVMLLYCPKKLTDWPKIKIIVYLSGKTSLAGLGKTVNNN
jgi:hypothetical protein